MAKKSTFGNVRKLPSGNWQVRYTHPQYPGETFRAPRTFKTRLDADAWRASTHADISRGTWKHPDAVKAEEEAAAEAARLAQEQSASDAYTASQWVAEWSEELQRGNYSANTIRTYGSDIKRFTETFGDVPLRSITAPDLTQWLQSLKTYTRTLKDGRVKRGTRSDAAVSSIRRVVVASLNAAVEAGRLDANPMPPMLRRTRESKGVTKPLDYLPTEAEVMAAVEYAAPPIGAAIMLAYKCGLRSGEVRGLRREDLVLTGDRPVVRVRRAVQRAANGGQVMGHGKSAAAVRDLPIDSATAAWLKRYLVEHVGPARDALVVYNPTTGELLSEKSLSEGRGRWKDARGYAGIRESFRFHDLRKACLTLLGRKGATLEELRRYGGHSDVKAVMIYQLATDEGLRDLINRPAPNSGNSAGATVHGLKTAVGR